MRRGKCYLHSLLFIVAENDLFAICLCRDICLRIVKEAAFGHECFVLLCWFAGTAGRFGGVLNDNRLVSRLHSGQLACECNA